MLFGMSAINISCYEELSMLSQLVLLKYAVLWTEFVFLHFSTEELVINSYLKIIDASTYSTFSEFGTETHLSFTSHFVVCGTFIIYIIFKVIFSKSQGQKTKPNVGLKMGKKSWRDTFGTIDIKVRSLSRSKFWEFDPWSPAPQKDRTHVLVAHQSKAPIGRTMVKKTDS